jgi:hypothetical protein
MIHLDSAQVAMLVTILGKGFIVFADSLEPPPENCGYWTRFLYNFIQRLASNSLKVSTTLEQKKAEVEK